ncbi:LexA family protein [Actinoplanes sp. CA-051413]|uniref:LexA family protein n=1 Tax=Actinoplanes sp. CA-051413 TaxID=3239899 RepID=UPI003D974422
MTAAVAPLLSRRQSRILAYIRAHHAQHGYAPSLRDIGAHVGLSTPSAVAYQVRELERMGWIRRAPGVARALVVLNPDDGRNA